MVFRKELNLSRAITLSSLILLVLCPFFPLQQKVRENNLQLWQYALILRRSIIHRNKDWLNAYKLKERQVVGISNKGVLPQLGCA